MAFLDELKVHIKAGRGGDGVVRWRREKFIDKGGPAGGNGGRGGNIFVRGMRNMHTFSRYAHVKHFEAEDGLAGMGAKKHGRDGEDTTIDFPLGTVITNLTTNEKVSLVVDGESQKLLAGGHGGLGNDEFKSSTNQSPGEWTPGKPGGEADFKIELELVADVGLIGLPNAGKSSLLNALTNATAKVGDYPFTTLDPNLGDMFGYILADIPGLIEGASEGKGLGVKFLKHVRRTRVLLHLVSFENGENMEKIYTDIRTELQKFDPALAEKQEAILLTKTDVVEDSKFIAKQIALFEKSGKKVFTVSLFDDASIKKFTDSFVEFLKETE